MALTPLHRVLGETVPELTFQMVERACAEKIQERADLDWKASPPLTANDPSGKEAQSAELAKDVAAFANSGGGLIVYGVAEDGKSGADTIVPIDELNDRTLQDIRQVAGSLIYPPVMSLDLVTLRSVDGGGSVLAMVVPDSLDAPHLVHPKTAKQWFGVPWRDGPHTQWMVERQIDSAYQRRELLRRTRSTDLAQFYADFVARCGAYDDRPFVVAIAIPDTAAPARLNVTQEDAHVLLDRLTAVGFGPLNLVEEAATRRGLRSFHRTGQRTRTLPDSAMTSTPCARIEVHRDGAVAMAFTRDGYFGSWHQRTGVAVSDLDVVGREFLALLLSWSKLLPGSVDYSARLGVAPSTQIFIRSEVVPHQGEYFHRFDEGDRVHSYQPVDGPVLTSLGPQAAIDSWAELVGDAIEQTGFRPSFTRWNLSNTTDPEAES